MSRLLTLDDYQDYQPTVEDLLAIQEYFEAEQLARAGLLRAREIAETDTRDESAPLPTVHRLFPIWEAPNEMSDAYRDMEAA